jgi:hypothetical protein
MGAGGRFLLPTTNPILARALTLPTAYRNRESGKGWGGDGGGTGRGSGGGVRRKTHARGRAEVFGGKGGPRRAVLSRLAAVAGGPAVEWNLESCGGVAQNWLRVGICRFYSRFSADFYGWDLTII